MRSIAPGDMVKRRRVFFTKTFGRWLRKTALSDEDLCEAVAEMAAGLVDADLGGQVFKKRVASAGRGKSGGARVLVGTNQGDRWFFLFGFEKKDRADIEARELAGLRKIAAVYLNLDTGRLAIEQKLGNLTEICHEEAKSPTH